MNQESRALVALSDAVLEIASTLEVRPVLQKLVATARELVGASYAALGIPDGHGGFSDFLTAGMSDETIAAIGPLPRSHGMLDAVLATTTSFRTDDLQADPRFRGWPKAHPDMRSMLGVPIVAGGEVIGAFYLTNKPAGFDDADQALIERFAAHAAVGITNAHLFERSRELSVIEERNRLARDLHDAVTQTMFSAVLAAESGARLAETDAAVEQLGRLKELTRGALEELRAIVFELRPADLGVDGLAETLRKHVAVVDRVHVPEVRLEVRGDVEPPEAIALEVFRVAQEAIGNALRHASASRVAVELRLAPDGVGCIVTDDGVGFDPDARDVRAKHLGLTSIEERMAAVGGTVRVDSAPGRGTMVSVEVGRA